MGKAKKIPGDLKGKKPFLRLPDLTEKLPGIPL